MIVRLTALLAVFVALLLGAQGAFGQQSATITVGDIYFCDPSYQSGVCETTIDTGDTVVWDFSAANIVHTSTACGDDCDAPTASPRWDSGLVNDGSTFSYTFTEPGAYAYFCRVHPQLQRGRIVVRAPATATPAGASPTPDSNADPSPTPDVVAPPDVGTGASGGDTLGPMVAPLAALGLLLVIASTVMLQRSRTIASNQSDQRKGRLP